MSNNRNERFGNGKTESQKNEKKEASKPSFNGHKQASKPWATDEKKSAGQGSFGSQKKSAGPVNAHKNDYKKSHHDSHLDDEE